MANREEPYDPYNKPRASQSSGDQRNEDWTNSGAQGGHRDQLAHIRDVGLHLSLGLLISKPRSSGLNNSAKCSAFLAVLAKLRESHVGFLMWC